MDIVVNVLKRQKAIHRIAISLVSPFSRGKLSPCGVVLGREHAVDRVSEGSWVPFEIKVPVLSLRFTLLFVGDGIPCHVGKMIVGYPSVVDSLETDESLCIFVDEDTVSTGSSCLAPLVHLLVNIK
jgi:hypothetical protein